MVKGPARVTTQTRGAANKYNVFFKTDKPGKYTVTATVRGKFSDTHDLVVAGRMSAPV